MLGLVKQWSSLICLASVASTIFELVLPPGKTEKTMRMVLGIFMINVIIFPFFERKNQWNLNIKKISSEYINKEKIKIPEKINGQIKNLAQENIKKVVADFLKENNFRYEKIEIFTDCAECKEVFAIRCKIYLNKSDAHLKEKIISQIEKNLKIKAEAEI